jgi:Icc-related predicted phosphoesterase
VKEAVRIAAVGDLHCTSSGQGKLQSLLRGIADRADVLVLCGDLTDYGHPAEAKVVAHELHALSLPVVAVLGNHDFESGHQEEIQGILREAGVHLLDGDAIEIEGIGFAGVKGFAGGFGNMMLEPWGEVAMKRFVQEAVDEALKLEGALARLRMKHRIAVLHYAPVQDTVLGEPAEIFSFLGSSRLEEPLDRYKVTAVFHGHAHHGAPVGRTKGGVPVYNVSLPLLQRTAPDEPPFRMLELRAEPEVSAAR